MPDTNSPLTRAEHQEFCKWIEAEHNSALVTSVEKLALNMEIMAKEQQEQGKRLETLEARDGEMWRMVVVYIVTAIVGGVIGFIFTRLGM